MLAIQFPGDYAKSNLFIEQILLERLLLAKHWELSAHRIYILVQGHRQQTNRHTQFQGEDDLSRVKP